MIRVALDAMGGDLGPRAAFDSTHKILSKYHDVEITLFYHDSFAVPSDFFTNIKSNLESSITLVKCCDYYSVDEEIERSLFRRTDTSLYKALSYVKQGHADVAVTFGNTGVMVALARRVLGLIKPKLYPALIRDLSLQPLRCLTDLGANVHCPPEMLIGFAELAAAYVEELSGETAKVGLLNVGIEASKGSSVIKQANHLLSTMVWPQYSGYAEGYELFQGDKNVIVCDGIVGNTVLKASEGLLKFLFNRFAERDMEDMISSFYQQELRHGACLVGVRGNVVKGHGGSDSTAMEGAIEYGIEIARAQLSSRIERRLT